ncbi:malto-oligosyltrehalose synthase [Flavitalea sp. BT771]|uniref:malto-oligosyltrehalose synthase n=1 Tax=Flavitalea sp. BT771 TaxID=3063329 RepID=UPI0026E30BC8|nr:malto-oligosyltrehalose synthase [Flavitalea sp. BT771]MDO6434552.1 malto-oligosyltrehalose synthase [Flavitalea sp. BT771]MDV6223452.1 malto-oligosyltrehalose synthase [Flavitalea sp. BT771]
MTPPASTYRIQLHEGFNFRQLEGIIPYLHDIGISCIYASPITRAIKGSQHGYDVTDPQVISPEIGTEEELAQITALLKKYEMTWVQDIVPNHMAYESTNAWVRDVLEKGKASPYYSFFDLEPGSSTLLGNKIMVPFLGSTLTECLQKKELRLDFTGERFVLRYYQQEYPVAISSYQWICTVRPGCPPSLLKAIDALEQEPCHHGDDPNPAAAFPAPADLPMSFDEESLAFIHAQVAFFNGHASLLKELMDLQHYVLTHAHLAATFINYRRFFTVNSLICLRMEDEHVFDTYHRQLRCWYDKGYIQGLRVDHIDGLAAPDQYIRRLRQTFGNDCYIVAEKILAAEEQVPAAWQLQGTTGYDFLAAAGALFTDPDGFHQIISFYRENIVADMPAYGTLAFEKKRHFLLTYMGGELDNLVRRAGVAEANKDRFRNALAIFMSSFPVYRLYPDTGGDPNLPDLSAPLEAVPENDRPLLQAALANGSFLARLMQFTGPLAAKGIEDTLFYVYDPLIARNEVGDSPDVISLSPAAFHQKMALRQKTWPHSMNAGTTHDTKRGEDSRIRLCWLSSTPDEWIAAVTKWQEINKPGIQPNDEYFIYQSLLGGIPPDLVITDVFRQRFHGMLTKALREAGTVTRWDAPDESYEKKCHAFLDAILDTESRFMEDFIPFAYKCMHESARFAIAQLLLRLTAPGVPDIYQGADGWELSFVDPDNRRPVDYDLRRQMLKDIQEHEQKGNEAVLDYVNARQTSGAAKLYTIYRTLAWRSRHRSVFEKGAYIPVDIAGPHLAYIRRHQEDWVLVIVPLIRMAAAHADVLSVLLPGDAPVTWTDTFTGATFQTSGNHLVLDSLLEKYPVAMLTGSNT